MNPPLKVLLTTPGGWWLPHPAKAFEARGALAGLWISGKNSTRIAPEHFRRCWPFHLAMKPLYHCAPQIWQEKLFYAYLPVWKTWFSSQRFPAYNVTQAIMGFATEPFDCAEKTGALKVVDCPNSHPTTYFGYWQRECDLWCPGEKVPIPQWMFARMNRELERADLVLPGGFAKNSLINIFCAHLDKAWTNSNFFASIIFDPQRSGDKSCPIGPAFPPGCIGLQPIVGPVGTFAE